MVTKFSGIGIIGIIACLAVSPAFAADKASKQEAIGVGMGATIGAFAGGPVGFVIGAAIGAKLGDEFHEKEVEVEALDSSLRSSQNRVSELKRNVAVLNADTMSLTRDLQRLEATARPELLSLLRSGIEMDLLFRTGEHELPDSTRTRLGELAASLASMPGVSLQLDGFADERGDRDYNRQLSARRAQFVRQVLQENGVSAERIRLSAHGESPAADESTDSYALERRVSLTLALEDAPSLAANPD